MQNGPDCGLRSRRSPRSLVLECLLRFARLCPFSRIPRSSCRNSFTFPGCFAARFGVFTFVASLVSGVVFGQYLARFANNYVTMYAGLASVIIALVFLYFIAAIFVYGGELNAAIMKSQLPKGMSLHAAQSRAHAETRA